LGLAGRRPRCPSPGTGAAPGEGGELVHAGPLVAQGYWRDPERTAERFKLAPPFSTYGGTAVWSGDTVVKGRDGLLRFRGRDDAMIKVSGNRISPTEIEEAALASGDGESIIDVLTLSFGCYHEDLADDTSDPAALTATSFATVLRDLGRVGILVVAGAGNDATARPFVPAAFAGDATDGAGDLPLVSVGSLNPNRSTVSLFSNSGHWVTTYRNGAAIVSTLPRRHNASSQASTDVAGIDTLPEAERAGVDAGTTPRPPDRATIDLDDYTSGFGVWSGTSFSAPVLAGQLAHAIAGLGPNDVAPGAMNRAG